MEQDDNGGGEESSDVSMIDTYDQNPRPEGGAKNDDYLLPPMAPVDVEANKKTLVLDMDETLIHSSFRHLPNPDFIVEFVNGGQMRVCYVLQRPGVENLLQELSGLYEIVVFTAGEDTYANTVLDRIDPRHSIRHRLTRKHCIELPEHVFVKDLSSLGRDLEKLIFVDDRPFNCYQSQNAYPIAAFTDDKNDVELFGVMDFCKRVAASTSDVREELARLSYAMSASGNGFLPPVEMSQKKTLVLDLEGVLVSSTTKRPQHHDFTVEASCLFWKRTRYVLKRPGLDLLLAELEGLFEIVVFSSADENFANAMLDALDPSRAVIPPTHRLFKKDFTALQGKRGKDLSKLGRQISKVICVDVAPFPCHQTPNLYPVFEFKGDMNDRTLFHLLDFCHGVAESTSDVRADLLFYFRPTSADWVEYSSRGDSSKKYYYNKVSKETTWQKPPELMDGEEYAAIWTECTSHDGRKYYFNKISKISQWNVPRQIPGRESAFRALVHVDDADRDAKEALRGVVMDFLATRDFRMTSSSTLEEFRAALDGCDEVAMISDVELKLLFDELLLMDVDRCKMKENETSFGKRRQGDSEESGDKKQKV